MLPVKIISVGKLGEPWMRQGCEEYLKRLGGMVTVTEIPEQHLPQNPSPAQIQQALSREAKLIRDKIPPRAFTVALCIEGEMMSSPKLAGVLERAAQQNPCAVFLIGSSYGLEESLKREAGLRLSFSPMTFPHQLARILLLEQLYRASSIQAGGKYHK
ncbi:MAG TPA: 23S rRNA (pseudouridine(1915)-N(3))-methyltransferase RlmH [Clostridiales bacterium]|nr:23S rRNA (pseudouridine(1915)-N(3))-methyltransferase RlmH [Clostridiales bacterium]